MHEGPPHGHPPVTYTMGRGGGHRGPGGGQRAPLARRLALGLVGLVAALGVGEGVVRVIEARSTVRLVWDVPGLRYEMAPTEDRNTFGFRERAVTQAKPAGTRRVAAIGDSVTYGMMVPVDATWPRRLEGTLRGEAQVLNFGVPGYDIASVAAQVPARVAAFEPDLVVYAFYVNDPQPTEMLAEGSLPVWVGVNPPPYSLLSHAIDEPLRRHSALFRLVHGALVGFRSAKEPPLDWDFFDTWATKLVANVAALHVPLVVLAIPPHPLAEPSLPACDGRAMQGAGFCAAGLAAYQRGVAWFEGHGVPVVDGLAAYRAGGKQELAAHVGDATHPNGLGHERLAIALSETVRAQLAALPR